MAIATAHTQAQEARPPAHNKRIPQRMKRTPQRLKRETMAVGVEPSRRRENRGGDGRIEEERRRIVKQGSGFDNAQTLREVQERQSWPQNYGGIGPPSL